MPDEQLRMVPAQERLFSPVLVLLFCLLAPTAIVALTTGAPRVLAMLAVLLLGICTWEEMSGRWIAGLDDSYASSRLVLRRLKRRARRRAWARGEVRRLAALAVWSGWSVLAVLAATVALSVAGLNVATDAGSAVMQALRVLGHVASYAACLCALCLVLLRGAIRDWDRQAASPWRASTVVGTADLFARLAGPRAAAPGHAADGDLPGPDGLTRRPAAAAHRGRPATRRRRVHGRARSGGRPERPDRARPSAAGCATGSAATMIAMGKRQPSRASLDLAADKVREAEFLQGLLMREEATEPVRYLFNATTNACYAAVEALRAASRRHPPLSAAVEGFRARLAADELCEYVMQRRHEAVPVGESRVRAARLRHRPDGTTAVDLVFKASNAAAEPVTVDVREASGHLVGAVRLGVDEIVAAFPQHTRAGIIEAAMRPDGPTVEEVEEALGFPRQWSLLVGGTRQMRLMALRRSSPPPLPSLVHQRMHERFFSSLSEQDRATVTQGRIFVDDPD